MSRYLSNQKLWRVINERGEYYYDIRLAGSTIDRIKIEEPALSYLKENEIL